MTCFLSMMFEQHKVQCQPRYNGDALGEEALLD